MQPELCAGDLVVIDLDRKPNPGDFVIVHLSAKNQNVIRRYRESDSALFQLLANNELWSTIVITNENEAKVLGVVVEQRKYS